MSGLVNGLVGKRSRAGHDTDLSLRMDVSGHNANLALSRLNNTGAIRANKTRLVLALHDSFYLDHVECWDAFSDADNEVHLGFYCLEDCVGGERRGHVEHCGLSTGLFFGFSNVGENGEAQVSSACLLVVDATDHVGSVSNGLFGMEGSLKICLFVLTCLPVIP